MCAGGCVPFDVHVCPFRYSLTLAPPLYAMVTTKVPSKDGDNCLRRLTQLYDVESI